MAVNSVITHTYDLETPLVITPLRHALATGDELGDRFDITVTQKGQPVDLTGAGVTGYFIRTADGATVIVTGSAAGNIASVTLPESCYAVPGRFTLTVKVSKGDVRHAVYVGEGAVLRSSTDTIIDPGHTIPDLDELLAKIAELESATAAANGVVSKANNAATAAETAAGKANTAASAANTAKTNADAATKAANDAAGAATTAKTNADKATTAANNAASAANTAKTSANTAAANANAKADYIGNATFTAHNVEPGGTATVTKTDKDGHAHFDFGLVKGDPGDIAGNAPSADKLLHARKINLDGDVTGGATFDGSQDITITTDHPNAFVGDNKSQTVDRWYRFASAETKTYNSDMNIAFFVQSGYTTTLKEISAAGILEARFRLNSTIDNFMLMFRWLCGTPEINEKNFKMTVRKTASNSLLVELWCYCGIWTGYHFERILEGSRTDNNQYWTLYTNLENGTTLPEDAVETIDSVKAYTASIFGVLPDETGDAKPLIQGVKWAPVPNDCNNLPLEAGQSMIFAVGPDCLNIPDERYWFINATRQNDRSHKYEVQFARSVNISDCAFYYRMCNYGQWTAWRKLAFFDEVYSPKAKPEIGGVNLLTGTKDFSGSWNRLPDYGGSSYDGEYLGLTVTKYTNTWNSPYQPFAVKKGERYTFSFYIKEDYADVKRIVWLYLTHSDVLPKAGVTNESNNITDELENGIFKRVYLTFEVTADGYITPRPELDTGDASCTMSVCGYKLERGDIPTDWSPAPEDTINPPHNYLYDGANLKEVFGSAEALHNAVAAGDFSKIRVGDYYPITLTGTVHDYADDVDKTLNNAVVNLEVAGINVYWQYGDSGELAGKKNHLVLCSRDLLPLALKFRSGDTTWTNEEADNPWLGSALYKTLNDTTNGVLPRVLATDVGPYVYAGADNLGMRWLAEAKKADAKDATGWGWKQRGRLFLPSEREVFGADTWSEHSWGGVALQWPIFAGSRRHIVKGLGNGGSRCNWWTESSLTGSTSNICYVTNRGITYYYEATSALPSAPLCFIFV